MLKAFLSNHQSSNVITLICIDAVHNMYTHKHNACLFRKLFYIAGRTGLVV